MLALVEYGPPDIDIRALHLVEPNFVCPDYKEFHKETFNQLIN